VSRLLVATIDQLIAILRSNGDTNDIRVEREGSLEQVQVQVPAAVNNNDTSNNNTLPDKGSSSVQNSYPSNSMSKKKNVDTLSALCRLITTQLVPHK